MILYRKFGPLRMAHILFAVLFLVGALPGTVLAARVLITPAARLQPNDQILGPLTQSQFIHIVISLNLRNEAQLHAFLANPHHPILTSAQFEQTYSPTQAQAAAVGDFLRQSGFTHVTIAPNRLLVSGDAPAGAVQLAFHTQLVHVRTHDGRDAYANSTDAQIPESLHSTVRAVLGLQTVYVMHTLLPNQPVAR